MIEINLLPEEYKKIKKTRILVLPKGIKFFISLWFFGLFLMLGLFLTITIEAKIVRLGKINKEWSLLQSKNKELEALKSQAVQLENEITAYKKIFTRSFFWSEKLNSISGNLVDGIWFTSLHIGSGGAPASQISTLPSKSVIRSMVISGSVFSIADTGIDSLNQFIGNLKRDEEFSRDFKTIELTSVQSKKIADKEVQDFTVVLSLKEEEIVQ
ncbi:MAG: hypothetical protein V1893_04165 [Candidatus Omnitrophota bacterium]